MGPTIHAAQALAHWNTSGILSVLTLVVAFAILGCVAGRKRQEHEQADERDTAALAERLSNGVTVWRTHRPASGEISLC